MQEHEQSVKALSDAFRKGIIAGLEEYGDRRIVPYPDEIIKESDMVLKEETITLRLRDSARLRLTYIKEGEPPFPEQCPVYLNEYSKFGGELFIENPRVSLRDAIMVSAKASYLEWFVTHYPEKEKANGRKPDAV